MAESICFVCPGAYAYFNDSLGLSSGGGAERQVHLLSTHLADQFDVHVVVADYGQPKTEVRDGVTLHRSYPLQSRQDIFQPANHFLLLARAMRRADADIYVHRGSPRNTALVYLLARTLRGKWVYQIAHDANIVERPATLARPVYWLFQRAVRDTDALIAQTACQRELLCDAYDVDATVVPNGYPTASGTLPFADREYVLWVGWLNEAPKRPHLFLDLAEQLPELHFRLVGPLEESNAYHDRLRTRAASLDNIELTGEVHPEDIHNQYRNAILLVNTSEAEGFPNTFLEAWRQRTPVVSLDIDPCRYLPFDRADGYADGELCELVQQCKQLSTNRAQWQSWADESKAMFESNLAIYSVAEQYADVLKTVLDS